MKKVCLLIGEGDSERYFFPKILERKSFNPLSQKEGSLSIYNRGDIYWFFPFPPNLGTQLAGKSKLKKSETYTLASSYIQNSVYIFSEDMYEVHLVAIFDTETEEAQFATTIADINNAIAASTMTFSSINILPVKIQIESWYFAGLEENFPYFLDKTDSDLIKLLSCKTSNRHNKTNFQKHIDLDKMIGAKDIAQAVAEHFNEEKATGYSDSFKDFDSIIKKTGLY